MSSGARRRPRRLTGHEGRLLAIALGLVAMAGASFLLGLAGDAFPSFASGAAGVAMVLFLRFEARAARRPLTLGHQLVIWWFWPLVVPLFVIATRRRRSRRLTATIAGLLMGTWLAVTLVFALDVLRVLG